MQDWCAVSGGFICITLALFFQYGKPMRKQYNHMHPFNVLLNFLMIHVFILIINKPIQLILLGIHNQFNSGISVTA